MISFQCESIIEDYDDDIIASFKKERKDPKKYMCRTTTGKQYDFYYSLFTFTLLLSVVIS